ncbi:hypothetical protein [Phormidium sp. CCY1219]|uniref:hypothetical protein n=1 Tax=Phormidium sp. CCY1219 TaxID=2886104 RepID=UPI002D1F350B|nr:hypothetical protein [Phormidium sp. CCY1219]MEB3830795.1 hypothetical protein [Phormidium sp. CCY1219]
MAFSIRSRVGEGGNKINVETLGITSLQETESGVFKEKGWEGKGRSHETTEQPGMVIASANVTYSRHRCKRLVRASPTVRV